MSACTCRLGTMLHSPSYSGTACSLQCPCPHAILVMSLVLLRAPVSRLLIFPNLRVCDLLNKGGPVLIVDGIRHNTHAHQMAIGSEVHMLARTESPSQSRGEEASSGRSMSMHASLHQKLIVQQVGKHSRQDRLPPELHLRIFVARGVH